MNAQKTRQRGGAAGNFRILTANYKTETMASGKHTEAVGTLLVACSGRVGWAGYNIRLRQRDRWFGFLDYGTRMAKASKSQVTGDVVIADGEELNLRNRNLAAFLAWIIPGAGHFYQRRYFKSLIFSVCVITSFVIGMFVAGGRCVYASWNNTEKRWQYVLQSGIGLAAIPAGIQAYAQRGGGEPPLGDFMIAPKSSKTLDDWHKETASGFDMGTLYTMIAGLLNILVVFDAYAGPLPPPVPKSKRRESADSESSESAESSNSQSPNSE